MYNIEFLKQIEASRRDIFRGMDWKDTYLRYCSPPEVKIVKCFEDINGEWVPNPVRAQTNTLEERE